MDISIAGEMGMYRDYHMRYVLSMDIPQSEGRMYVITLGIYRGYYKRYVRSKHT